MNSQIINSEKTTEKYSKAVELIKSWGSEFNLPFNDMSAEDVYNVLYDEAFSWNDKLEIWDFIF